MDELKKNVSFFDQVDENLYRGGQPQDSDYELLKSFGIKKIINFRAEKKLSEKEKQIVESLGMEYIHIPWTIYGSFHPDVFPSFLEVISDKDENPVFFHCRRGVERTGVISAAYRMKNEQLSYKEALMYLDEYPLKFMWRRFAHSKLKKYSEQFADN